ncbi:MAG: EAL domain-containing protein [Thiohalocapsa sp.]
MVIQAAGPVVVDPSSGVAWLDFWDQYPIASVGSIFAAFFLGGFVLLLLRNRRLAAEHQFFAAAVSQASDGLVVIDAETLRFLQFNDAACLGLGFTRAEFNDVALDRIQAELSNKEIRERIAKIVAAGGGEFDTRHRCKNGSVVDVRVNNQVIVREGRRYLVATWIDITDRLTLEQALRESEARFRATFDLAAVGIAEVGTDGHWLRINQKFCDILGYSLDEMRGLSFSDIADPREGGAMVAFLQRCMSGEIDNDRIEERCLRKDGSFCWVDLTVAVARREDGEVDHFITVIEDIDQRKRGLAALAKASSLYRGLIEKMHDGVAIYDAIDSGEDFVFRMLNPAGARSAQLDADEVVGRKVRDVFPNVEGMGLFDLFKRVYQSGRAESHKTTRYQDDRIALWVENHVFKLPGGELVAVFADVSEQMAAERALLQSQATLQRMAYYDALTGLPNRRLLLDRLGQAIAVAERDGTWIAVCYLDLDDFKPVNDELGHATGDALLKAIAERLDSTIRAGDTVSRWGGDEFTLLLTGLADVDEFEQTVSRLLGAVAAPYKIGARELTISASLGAALYPRDNRNGETLLRQADHAMYMAKLRGRNGYHFFDSATIDLATSKQARLQRIKEALDQNELRLLYQPIVDMRDGRVDGVEALVRWQHPERGLLPPSDFLPDIEGDELIRGVDRWVLQQAMDDLTRWIEQGFSLKLQVNVSTHSLVENGFIDSVGAAIENRPTISADKVGLEILENDVLRDLEAVTKAIRSGSAIGLRFALDDFGTGSSTPTYFRDLPAQVLKIDQGSVRGILEDKDDLRVVEAAIGLSHAFNRTVVGEGVESEAHALMLLRFGCELGQGYGIAHPMPPEQLIPWLETYHHPPLWGATMPEPRLSEDLSLLKMEAEHRGWINAIVQQDMAGSDVAPRLLEAHQCCFGRWYAEDGLRRFGHMELFKDLATLHERVHEIGQDLLRKRAAGGALDDARLEQLDNASNALLDRLAMLQNAVVDHINREADPSEHGAITQAAQSGHRPS